ncbi:hypothetical protein [Streptomyces panaciradicis]|uniref:hypothetical protein n=1 Tax=Streptomyces panaciradicis TaxID=1470261 RepID=UPI00201CB404|nr:hypothetical protein [Streptomyces panaciradicis]MCL6672565.1 hypothetical protein [Streptomyces panaciradicis]
MQLTIDPQQDTYEQAIAAVRRQPQAVRMVTLPPLVWSVGSSAPWVEPSPRLCQARNPATEHVSLGPRGGFALNAAAAAAMTFQSLDGLH